MNRIQSRSPYFIKYKDVDLVFADIQLYIYTGSQNNITDRANGFVYQVNISPISNSEEVVFDASEMIDSILDVGFDGEYLSQMVWVDYAITPTILVGGVATQQATESIVNLEAYSGFRYHEEGAQNSSMQNDTNTILLTNRVIYKGADAAVRVPVLVDGSDKDVSYVKNGKTLLTETISPSSDSSTRIVYVSSADQNVVDNFKERVLEDSGLFEGSSCLDSFLGKIDLYGVDAIYINGERIAVRESACNKYDSYKITFINKFGALQDVYFDGKSESSLKTKNESKFKSNTLESDYYNISNHSNRYISKNGVDSMKISTGFISEEYVDVIKELELSRKVWIEKNGYTLPVDVKEGVFKYKTRVNDKLISYTTEIDFSFSSISNIR
jgi:hypothetical protein